MEKIKILLFILGIELTMKKILQGIVFKNIIDKDGLLPLKKFLEIKNSFTLFLYGTDFQ